MSSKTQPTYRDFLRVMTSGLPDNERLVIDIANGDPNDNAVMRRAERKYLRRRTAEEWAEFELPSERNLYLSVMSVLDGVHNRRGESFQSGIALLIDDVGDVSKERGIKVPKDLIAALKPTALVETSEGNMQAWFRLTRPLRDRDLFDRIIRAFIREKLMGHDPGMSSVARIARVPYGLNMKPSRDGWKVRLAELNEEISFTPAELIKTLGLILEPALSDRVAAAPPPEDDDKAIEDFKYKFLKEHLESADRRNEDLEDRRGEWKVVCPDVGNHSDGGQTGTFLIMPGRHRTYPEKYFAFFRCAHSCTLNTGDAIRRICEDNPEAKAEWNKFWLARTEVDTTWADEANRRDWPFEVIARAAREYQAEQAARMRAFLASLKGVSA